MLHDDDGDDVDSDADAEHDDDHDVSQRNPDKELEIFGRSGSHYLQPSSSIGARALVNST